MHVRVLYFAVVRERLGLEEETVELPSESTVGSAMAHLGERHPALRELARHLQLAVNHEVVALTTPLKEDDELALIPPVAGGSGLYRLQDTPLSLDEAVRSVAHPEVGGIVTFVGAVRSQSGGRSVERLQYEAYPGMAEHKLRQIGEELAQKYGARLCILHRTGTLAIGEPAVIIAAAAPHRAEAFSAAREAIERLKAEVPIWKKEFGADGAVWVGLGP
jgi:molybdopterin synthase catalytic subunit